MSFPDQKVANINNNNSNASDPNENVANSSAAQPWREESAASHDGASPARDLTPQLDDADVAVGDYQEHADGYQAPVVDASLAQHANNLAVSAFAPNFNFVPGPLHSSDAKESKHFPPPSSSSYGPVRSAQDRFHPYGPPKPPRIPEHFQVCILCDCRSYSFKTGAKCRTCGVLICRSCFVKKGSSNRCSYCTKNTLQLAQIAPVQSAVDAGSVEAMRMERAALLAELKGTNPHGMTKKHLITEIEKYEAAAYRAFCHKRRYPRDPSANDAIRRAESALDDKRQENNRKIELIDQVLNIDNAITQNRQLIEREVKMRDRILRRNCRDQLTEAAARRSLDFSALLEPTPGDSEEEERANGLVNGDGYSNGVYVGNGSHADEDDEE